MPADPRRPVQPSLWDSEPAKSAPETAEHVAEDAAGAPRYEDEAPLLAETLSDVARRAASCTACGLSAARTHVVFGEGNPEAPLMLIGEGPGAMEDATGRPFVGRAGKLLDECLKENGLSRTHVYICNLVRCRAHVMDGTRDMNRPPTLEEIRACSPWLLKTIEIVQPLVILCLGGPAASSVIHPGFKIVQERGTWFASKLARYAIAALHPAYILRQHGAEFENLRGLLVADIDAARRKVVQARREPSPTLF